MKGEATSFQSGPYITDLYYHNPTYDIKMLLNVKRAAYVSF